MPKKTKIGKDRKDKFYKLAKETGFRSRAAFKLIQLNRRFGFLQQSQVCVDLCAAPGGWMQVAKQNMPVSSIVIGIDLFPIKAIPGCIALTEDITTEKCRQALTKELKTWKVDVFLNDGAPNVGRNWLFDAYQQICLSLGACKLATEFLRPGGWFITKVFRSKDYNAFVWVLKQFFKKVYATKPSASRKESAEIFVVCQGYKAPTKIDPKLLDAKYVFEELDLEPTKKIDMLKDTSQIKKAKAVGYDSIDLRKIMTITEFLKASSALDVLQVATELRFDDPKIENHELTTIEIKECVKDIKVLGRKDLKDLIKWWKKLKEEFYPEEKPKKEGEGDDDAEPKRPLTEEEKEQLDMENMEKYIEEMKMEEEKDEKRKKKKSNKEKTKTMQKVALKMAVSDGGPQDTGDENIFNLREIKNPAVLKKMAEGLDMTKKKSNKERKKGPVKVPYGEDDLNDEEQHIPNISSDLEPESEDEYHEDMALDSEDGGDDDDDWSESKNGEGQEGGEIERNRNPLLTDLDYRDKDSKRLQKAQLWFEKDVFKDLEKSEDKDEDLDLDKMVKNYKKKGIEVIGEADNSKQQDLSKMGKKLRQRAKHGLNKEESSDSDSSDDEVAGAPDSEDEVENKPPVKRFKLNEEELAVGQMMITSKKAKRDLIDGAWNRYMFNDDNLPDWFVEDEKKSMKRNLPIPEEFVQSYRQNLTEFNTRSIKKVMEAKTRKKRRQKKQMEKLSKKAANILENEDQSGQEKAKLLKKLYKKTEPKKQEVAYVVSKKTGVSGRKVSRPAGVKGRFKVVDPRMKKDMRAEKQAMKKQRGSKGGKGGGAKGGKAGGKGGAKFGKGGKGKAAAGGGKGKQRRK